MSDKTNLNEITVYQLFNFFQFRIQPTQAGFAKQELAQQKKKKNCQIG